jgi:hypothetical protein
VFSPVETDVIVDVFGYVIGVVQVPENVPPVGAPAGGVPPVTLIGSGEPGAAPVVGDVDGDGFVDDVPADVGAKVGDVVVPGGGRWEWRLTGTPQSLDGFVSVSAGAPADIGRRVWVQVLTPGQLGVVGLQGVGVSVVPVDGLGAVSVAVKIDYGRFKSLYGGDWSERLQAVAGDCTWSPGAAGCDSDGDGVADPAGLGVVVGQNNDLVEHVMSFIQVFPEDPALLPVVRSLDADGETGPGPRGLLSPERVDPGRLVAAGVV